jgi:hypothetical protein
MLVVSVLGAISGAAVAFLRARIGVLAAIACVLVVTGAVAAVHSPLAFGLGLLAAAATQIAYLATGYVLEHARERATRRAMQACIGRELKSLYVPQTSLPPQMIELVAALNGQRFRGEAQRRR